MADKTKDAQTQKEKDPQSGGKDSGFEEKCEEYKNDLKRLAAEFDNYKKRTQKQSEISRQLGREDVLVQMLTLSDEFEQALKHSKGGEDANEGLLLLSKKLSAIISSFNVEEIICGGEPDPNFHEAMLQVPGEPKGKICEVLRKGYKIGGRLLRPAQISVYSGEKNGNDKEKKTNRAPGSESGGENPDGGKGVKK